MKRRAVFFDRDNTLIVGNDYLGDPEKVVLMEGAADAVARSRRLGFATVVVSNQSGVARGMFDEDAVHAVNRRIDELLRQANSGAVIDYHDFCPYHPDATIERYRADSDLRKPRPGMILAAAQKLALDLEGSWVIGDAPRDIAAGYAAGCRTILLRPRDIPASPAAQENLAVPPEYVVTSLKEAIDYIEEHVTESRPSEQNAKSQATGEAHFSGPGAASEAPQLTRLTHLAEQILGEVKRFREQPPAEFSLSKLFAGITQIIALAMLPLAYLNRNNAETLGAMLLGAIFLQLFTIALLIMGRQK